MERSGLIIMMFKKVELIGLGNCPVVVSKGGREKPRVTRVSLICATVWMTMPFLFLFLFSGGDMVQIRQCHFLNKEHWKKSKFVGDELNFFSS